MILYHGSYLEITELLSLFSYGESIGTSAF